MLVVFHLHRQESLSHSVVEREDRRIVENDVDHLLEFVRTLREEEGKFTSDFEIFDVLRCHAVAESVSY